MIFGAIVSITVTTAEAELMFPLISLTKRVTVTGLLTSAQEKVFWSSQMDSTLQLSVEPLSMLSAIIDAKPNESRPTVKFVVTTIGAMLSSMVINAVAESMLPETSSTYNVMI